MTKILNKMGTIILIGVRISYLILRIFPMIILMIPVVLFSTNKKESFSKILEGYCQVTIKPDDWLEKIIEINKKRWKDI